MKKSFIYLLPLVFVGAVSCTSLFYRSSFVKLGDFDLIQNHRNQIDIHLPQSASSWWIQLGIDDEKISSLPDISLKIELLNESNDHFVIFSPGREILSKTQSRVIFKGPFHDFRENGGGFSLASVSEEIQATLFIEVTEGNSPETLTVTAYAGP